MDQELSHSMFFGSAIIFLIGVVAIAIVIFGFGRTMAVSQTNGMSSKLTDDNIVELNELNSDTTLLSKSAIASLVERNDLIVEVTCRTSPSVTVRLTGDNIFEDTVETLNTYYGGYTNLNTTVKKLEDGTYTVYIHYN